MGDTENAQRADGYRRNRLGDTRALLMDTGLNIGNLYVKTQNLWERACSGRRSDDGGITVDDDVECYGLIASSLAPTLILLN
ncbi:hypothetical protein PMI22_00169 [Pseudomonas sp. GM21]|jgi:hypothetical protein|uniref:hypothetical protein n=1 Tax=Pseudomonas TaxID=286 RepID=UPI00027258C5|nr:MULTISPECIES: hypothetical protein [Pseudomonas]EJM25734.1 hypothetical protein PMI22_00169 [Pseudomonas sp. GM21]MDR6924525.1 hypothetical protein [Pseudomonas sp. BE134]MDR7281580.1 hypothetical protein [Pseudomonas corrugata]